MNDRLPPPPHGRRKKWKRVTMKRMMGRRVMENQRRRTTMTQTMRITCPNNLASPQQQPLVFPKKGGTI